MTRIEVDYDYVLSLGDVVVIDRNGALQEGIIRFKGETDFKPEYKGIWFGIEVTDGSIGKNSGEVGGRQYFDCAEGMGVFVIRNRIKFIVKDELPQSPKEDDDLLAGFALGDLSDDSDDDDGDTAIGLSALTADIMADLAPKKKKTSKGLRVPTLDDLKDVEDDEPPPPPAVMHPQDVPPPPSRHTAKEQEPEIDPNASRQITQVRGDEEVTHNPLHSLNKPRYAAARQQAEEKSEETNLFKNDIETLAHVDKLKLSDLDRDGTGQVRVDELQDVMDKLYKYKNKQRMYRTVCRGVCVGMVFFGILVVCVMQLGHEITKQIAINSQATMTDRSGKALGTETYDTPLDPTFQTYASTDKIAGYFGRYYVNAEVAMVIQSDINVYRFLTHQVSMEFILDRRGNTDNLTLVIVNSDGSISYIAGRPPSSEINATAEFDPYAELAPGNGTYNVTGNASVGATTRRRMQSKNLNSQAVNFVNSKTWETIPEASPGAAQSVAFHIVCFSYSRDVVAAGSGVEPVTTAGRIGPHKTLTMNSPFAFRFKVRVSPKQDVTQNQNSALRYYLASLYDANSPNPAIAVFLKFSTPGGNSRADLVVSARSKVGSSNSAAIVQVEAEFPAAWTVQQAGDLVSIELIVKATTIEVYSDGVKVLTAGNADHLAASGANVQWDFEGAALDVYAGGDPTVVSATDLNFPISSDLQLSDIELDCQTAINAADLFVWVPQKKNYKDASDFCRATYGTTLVSLRTQQENDAFTAWYHQIAPTMDWTWIGARQIPQLTEELFDSVEAGQGWFWTDNGQAITTHSVTAANPFQNWADNPGVGPEPNEYGGGVDAEDCGAMYGASVSNAGKWFDIPCQGNRGKTQWKAQFACEKQSQTCYSWMEFNYFPRRDPGLFQCWEGTGNQLTLAEVQAQCTSSQPDRSKRCVGVSYEAGKETAGDGCIFFFHVGWDTRSTWEMTAAPKQTIFYNHDCAGSAQPSPAPTPFPSITPTKDPTRTPTRFPTTTPTKSPTALPLAWTQDKVHVSGPGFRLNYADAVNYCKNVYNGHLFQPRTDADNGYMATFLKRAHDYTINDPAPPTFEYTWMGMRSTIVITQDNIVGTGLPGTKLALRQGFQWTTEVMPTAADDFVDCPGCYKAWAPTDPNGFSVDNGPGWRAIFTVQCAVYRLKPRPADELNPFAWLDEACEVPRDFVCVVDPFTQKVVVPAQVPYDHAQNYCFETYGKPLFATASGEFAAPLRQDLYNRFAPAFPNPTAYFQNGVMLPAGYQVWMAYRTGPHPIFGMIWKRDDSPIQGYDGFNLHVLDPQCEFGANMNCGTDPEAPNTQPADRCVIIDAQDPVVVPAGWYGGAVDCSPTSTVRGGFICNRQIPPTPMPSKLPTKTPSKQPTKTPTKHPTRNPSKFPTKSPTTPSPITRSPSKNPTTPHPSVSPTTPSPIGAPTDHPATPFPSGSPTTTLNPSTTPSKSPSKNPTDGPSSSPSKQPTNSPSNTPTKDPTKEPSRNPSTSPTDNPSRDPSASPTKLPSTSPTPKPTDYPSFSPTTQFSGFSLTIANLTTHDFVNRVQGPPITFSFDAAGGQTTGNIVCQIRATVPPAGVSGGGPILHDYPCVATMDPVTHIVDCVCNYVSGDGTQTGGQFYYGKVDIFTDTACVWETNVTAGRILEPEPVLAQVTTVRYLWDVSSETYAIFGIVFFVETCIAIAQLVRVWSGHAMKRSMLVTMTHFCVLIVSFAYACVCFFYASLSRSQASYTLAVLLAAGAGGANAWCFSAIALYWIHLMYEIKWRNMATANADGRKRWMRLAIHIYVFVLTFSFAPLAMLQTADANQNITAYQRFTTIVHGYLFLVTTANAVVMIVLGSWMACKLQTVADDDEIVSSRMQMERAFSEFEEEEKPKGDALAVRLASVSVIFGIVNLLEALVALVVALTWPLHQFTMSSARIMFLVGPVLMLALWLYLYFPTVARAIEKARVSREKRMVDADGDSVDLDETFQGAPLPDLEDEPRRKQNEVDLDQYDDNEVEVEKRRSTHIDFHGSGHTHDDVEMTTFASARAAAGSRAAATSDVDIGDMYGDAGVTDDGRKKKKKKKKHKKKHKKKKKKHYEEDLLGDGYGDTFNGQAAEPSADSDGSGGFYEGPVATAVEYETAQTPVETNDIPAQPRMAGLDDVLNGGNTNNLGGEGSGNVAAAAGGEQGERHRGDTVAVFDALPTLPDERRSHWQE